MLLLLASAAVAITVKPPVRADTQALATIRIERPALANEKEWNRAPQASRRESVRRDERGQLMLLRMIEHE